MFSKVTLRKAFTMNYKSTLEISVKITDNAGMFHLFFVFLRLKITIWQKKQISNMSMS